MSDWKDEGYRNKNAKFRNDKKNKKNQIKNAQRNKSSFIYDETTNINDVPEHIYYNKNNNIQNEKSEISIIDNVKEDKLLNKTNKEYDENQSEEEYEQYDANYFEPVVYVKK
jgi:hypothetical protein